MAQGHTGALLHSLAFLLVVLYAPFLKLQPPLHRPTIYLSLMLQKAPPVSLVKFHIEERGAQNESCSETGSMTTKMLEANTCISAFFLAQNFHMAVFSTEKIKDSFEVIYLDHIFIYK